MPRKTKEIVPTEDIEIKEKKSQKLAKKATKTDSKSLKKSTSDATKNTTSEAKKKTTKKSETTVKKSEATKNSKAAAPKAKATKKVTSTKKSSSQAKSKNPATKTKTTTKKAKKVAVTPIVEYYDLPYRYNQTVVKLLAQTPNSLFVYWDISDSDRENYIKNYGDDFFTTTKPVLKIYNDTLNYSFEIDINDFANCWYISVNDADCIYRIELARRPIHTGSNIKENYIYITSSNKIDAPNDHILFEKITPDFNFKFRNVTNNQVTYKNISNFKTNIIEIKQLYSNIYGKENIQELNELSNPSSNFSSRI